MAKTPTPTNAAQAAAGSASSAAESAVSASNGTGPVEAVSDPVPADEAVKDAEGTATVIFAAGTGPVEANINGQAYSYARGEPVNVPETVLAVLEDAGHEFSRGDAAPDPETLPDDEDGAALA